MSDWEIRTIALGYDGSEGGDQGLRLAKALACCANARVVVVTAFRGPEVGGKGEMEGKVNPGMEASAAVAENAVLSLRSAGVEAEADVLEGHAADVLLRAAEASHADLIIVGRRGHGHLADLLLGSIAESVVRRAKRPVLVAQ